MWDVKANEQEQTFMSTTEEVSELFLQTGEISFTPRVGPGKTRVL